MLNFRATRFFSFLILVLTFSFKLTLAQSYYQNFDGADTSKYTSIKILFAKESNNIWQIGKPHKHYFDSAYSKPNVLVTDTSKAYPVNDTSVFSFKLLCAG